MNTGSVLAQFTITLSKAVAEPVMVEWFTSDGTAKAGVDYAANKGTAVFAPGETAKTVDILVFGRAVGTEDRSFFVEMLPPTNAILGAAIGECIIHVDTSGSQPVTTIIVPTGPKGDEGESAYETWLGLPGNAGKTEQEFIDSLKPDPADIAQDVAPLIDVGSTSLTAQGTEQLGKPDTTTVKAIARRVAYAAPAKIATVTLADGNNTITAANLTGDTLNFSGSGFVPRIKKGNVLSKPEWKMNADGSITIIGATAGDVFYGVEYDFVSDYHSHKVIQTEIMDNLAGVGGSALIGGATYASIRAYSGNANRINCLGRQNIFDGASGVFYLDAADTTSADNDGTILVDATGRRWKRDFSGDFNPLWFGVKFDGVTACHAEWQKCIDAAGGEWINIGSHGSYSVISAPLIVRHHMKIRGVNSSYNGSPNSWIHGTHTGNIFELAETTRGMRIEGVYFSGVGCTALNSKSFYWADTILKDCSFDLSLNYGMKGQFIEVYADKCQFGVGALGVPAHANWTPVFGTWTASPFQMSNVCTFHRCRFEHSKSQFGAFIWAGAYLLSIQSCIFQYNTGGNTVVLTQGVTNVDFDSCYFEANSNNSFLWDANVEGTGTRAYGRYKFTNNYADTRNQALSAVISTYDQPVEMNRNYIFGNAADYYLTRNSNGGAFETGTISSASDNYLVGGYAGKYNRNQHVIAGGGAGRATLNAPVATTPAGTTTMQVVGTSNINGSALQIHNSLSIDATDYHPVGKIQFCNGGNPQHHIVGYSNKELVFGLNGTDYLQLQTTWLAPWADNSMSLGTAGRRYSIVYSATGAINTSDERKKSEFFDITDAERKAALEIKGSIRKFKMLDAVEEKGFDDARWHFGVGAQTVGNIMRKHGLNPEEYGFWCHDVWEAEPEYAQEWDATFDENGEEISPAGRTVVKEAVEAGESYGIRYDELAMFILSAI